ncbi:MAG: diguanylate cyclase [Pyrinomonadaceae bacterium]
MSSSEPLKNTLRSVIGELAAESGLAVVIADDAGREIAAANNNSICALLYHSSEFGPRCAEYCGRAYASAVQAGGAVGYECHAGLECRALALQGEGGRPLVAIIGRTFLKSKNYRNATARSIGGDWRKFPATELFENVMLSTSPAPLERLERAIGKIDLAELTRGETAAGTASAADRPAASPRDAERVEPIIEIPTADETDAAGDAGASPDIFEISSSSLMPLPAKRGKKGEQAPPPAPSTPAVDPFESSLVNFNLDLTSAAQRREMNDREAWRGLIGSLLQVSYRGACQRILEFLSKHYGIESSVWLQPERNEFEVVATFGEFKDRPIRIGIAADDKRIRAAVNDDSPIVLKERQAVKTADRRAIQLFPVVIGGEVRNALGVAGSSVDHELNSRIVKFCRYVASRLEILRLREQVAERDRTQRFIREFNEQLRNIDSDNFWHELTAVSAELLGAERASLLLPDREERLVAKASIGARADLSYVGGIGERVARAILEKGKPVLVTGMSRAAVPPAPKERKYKTSSFICYPIMLGDKAVGVINFTDKIDGGSFDRRDIEVLDSIAPQLAVAIDRTILRDKAGEYAQLSITDTLTGLLNRRYLEERFTEEILRSNRTGDAVSCMMLDVDEFKSYNDKFGHSAGDEALRIVGRVLRETLRGADVPARYGGEEFAVLLPQTSAEEAEVIAERVRRNIDMTEFPKRRVTVSIGVASRTSTLNNVPDLIDAADKALYQAKRLGRNLVKTFDPTEDQGEKVH